MPFFGRSSSFLTCFEHQGGGGATQAAQSPRQGSSVPLPTSGEEAGVGRATAAGAAAPQPSGGTSPRWVVQKGPPRRGTGKEGAGVGERRRAAGGARSRGAGLGRRRGAGSGSGGPARINTAPPPSASPDSRRAGSGPPPPPVLASRPLTAPPAQPPPPFLAPADGSSPGRQLCEPHAGSRGGAGGRKVRCCRLRRGSARGREGRWLPVRAGGARLPPHARGNLEAARLGGHGEAAVRGLSTKVALCLRGDPLPLADSTRSGRGGAPAVREGAPASSWWVGGAAPSFSFSSSSVSSRHRRPPCPSLAMPRGGGGRGFPTVVALRRRGRSNGSRREAGGRDPPPQGPPRSARARQPCEGP